MKKKQGFFVKYYSPIVILFFAHIFFSSPAIANEPPNVVNDLATTNKNNPIILDVLANDSDLDGDSLVIDNVSDPAHGTVSITTINTIIYAPDPDFYGADSFQYTAGDGNGGSTTAVVSVTVSPTFIPCDVNGSEDIDLSDAVLSLQLLAEISSGATVNAGADVNADGKIGLAETMYILQVVSGIRPQPGGSQTLSIMGLVVDPNGNPLMHAIVGESLITDSNGVVVGDAQATAKGWFAVSADGYATGYAKPSGTIGGNEIFESWLTPFGGLSILPAGGYNNMIVGQSAETAIQVLISGDLFENSPVMVGLAAINPLDIGPLFEPLNTGEDLFLKLAFALQTQNIDGENVPLKAAQSLSIRVFDGGSLSDTPVIAYFNAENGSWDVIENGCRREGPNHFLCTIPRLSPLFGLFDTGEPIYLQSQSVGSRSTMDFNKLDLNDDYKEAQVAATGSIKILEKLCVSSPSDCTGNPCSHQFVKDAMTQLADAAQAYANSNQNESGKMKLLNAAGRIQLACGDIILDNDEGVASNLLSSAKSIATKIGNELLAAWDCSKIREMIAIAEQNMFMGNETLGNALMDAVRHMKEECDTWEGTVSVRFFVASSHPVLPSYTLEYSMGDWRETHVIKMYTNAETLVLGGYDRVSLQFPEVSYKDQDPSHECDWLYQMRGAPQSAELNYLSFDGTYDGETFSLGSLQQNDVAPITIVNYMLSERKLDGQCVPYPGSPSTFSYPGYFTVLAHGLCDVAPPITIQEMLDNGIKVEVPIGDQKFEIIRGDEEILNPCIELGRYPFEKGIVQWSFKHINSIIPLE